MAYEAASNMRVGCKMSAACALQPRAVNVDLQTDATLQVDISDALSERDKVKFTVHTKVSTLLPHHWVPHKVLEVECIFCSVGSIQYTGLLKLLFA